MIRTWIVAVGAAIKTHDGSMAWPKSHQEAIYGGTDYVHNKL